ncbi:GGDEF domain-containing protein [Mangrovicella endophytica]|uniref:GGDEF domain-containing protein n=1 Tax=Mangrovicella endophytica TaxID=2066697 RepID=UPI000C9E5C26|nr:GGDEF domain-containing protein [Mangrovicella endophytica]
MSIRKVELAVFVMLLAVAISATLVFAADQTFQNAMQTGSRLVGNSGRPLVIATYATLIGTLLFGFLYVIPAIRRQSQEQGQLHALAGELHEQSRHLKHAALTDPLTGMNNRRLFDEALTQYLEEFRRVGRPLGLMLLDLDHFKSVNDMHGHDVGDAVLCEVARCLGDYTRYHDIAARMGGEEFAIIVPNAAMPELTAYANRIRRAVEGLVITSNGKKVRVTISVGLAVADGTEDAPGFLKRADVKLYDAKTGGRNRIVS